MAVRGKRKRFNFHGKFDTKSAAVRKEREIDGAFIIRARGYYYVVTERK